MPSPIDFSTSNVLNSVSLYLAEYWISAGLVVYWQDSDALQISTTGWYFEFNENREDILAESAVETALAASRGVLTIVSAYPAEPRFVTRLISDVTEGNPQEVRVPVMVLDVQPVTHTRAYEMGTTLKWRYRELQVECLARNEHEQRWFADHLEVALAQYANIAIANHDDTTLNAVGDVLVVKPTVSTGTFAANAEALVYQVGCEAMLEYVV